MRHHSSSSSHYPQPPANQGTRNDWATIKTLLPYLWQWKWRVLLALSCLIAAKLANVGVPLVLKQLIDQGLSQASSAHDLALHFAELFGVAAALAVFSAARYYMVSWLGERITTDVRNAVYAHVLHQSPAFFETTQSALCFKVGC